MDTRNKNLKAARKRKDDEWYTRVVDVENELKHYDLRGKTVYMPCDYDTSAFWLFMHTHFAELGLKAIVATHYNDNSDPAIYYTGGDDMDTSKYEIYPLQSNGYMCADNVELLDICEHIDVIITNPPFSKVRELYKLWLDRGIDLLVLGTINVLTYKCLKPYFMDGTLHIGYAFNVSMAFDRPDETVGKVSNITWYTTLPVHKKYEYMLTKKFKSENYERFKYIDAINVYKSKDIPYDYAGLMAVPISFMKWLDPERFELFDILNSTELTSGRRTFARLLIRNRMLQ